MNVRAGSNFNGRLIYNLIHSFQMYPFSILWKRVKLGTRKGALGTKGLMSTSFILRLDCFVIGFWCTCSLCMHFHFNGSIDMFINLAISNLLISKNAFFQTLFSSKDKSFISAVLFTALIYRKYFATFAQSFHSGKH